MATWPYKAVKLGAEKPLLPVSIGNVKTGQSESFYGLLDSGSDTCFFDAEVGRSLGIEIEKGRVANVHGVVPGKWQPAYQHQVRLRFLGTDVVITAGFMFGLSKHGYGILGQRGFFDQVESVTFDRKKGIFGVVETRT